MMSNIYLSEITPNNWKTKFSLREAQKNQVASFNDMMARAYAYRNQNSQVYLIYRENTPIGAAMYYQLPEDKAYNLCQFFIDEEYQGKGYGKKALKLLLELMRNEDSYNKVILCYLDGNEAAKNFYLSLGFLPTGEVDDDEIIMSLDL